jgi:syntaxin 1B/2/3
MTRANTAGQEIKARLDAIKATLGKGKPGAQARGNLYNNCCKEFHTVMNDYQTTYQQVRDQMNENKKRQLRNLPTETPLTEEQIDQVIASGQEGEVMQRAMMMEDLTNLEDLVADVEERHAEILRLERSVMEILELFRDLSMLVDVQVCYYPITFPPFTVHHSSFVAAYVSVYRVKN